MDYMKQRGLPLDRETLEGLLEGPPEELGPGADQTGPDKTACDEIRRSAANR
jgi:hypothetical protein